MAAPEGLREEPNLPATAGVTLGEAPGSASSQASQDLGQLPPGRPAEPGDSAKPHVGS